MFAALLFGLSLWILAVAAIDWGLHLPHDWIYRVDNPLLRRAGEARAAAQGSHGLTVHNSVLFDGPAPVGLVPSANLSPGNRPRLVVLHYSVSGTAGPALNWLRRSRSGVSAHLLIDRDGRITQLVPFDYKAWHAGRSRWRGEIGLNGKSIGIELVNWGPLRRGPDGHWRSVSSRRVPSDQVETLSRDRGSWHRYGERQIQTLARVLHALRAAYPIAEVVGHQDIAPGRKTDPGPAFPWHRLKGRPAAHAVSRNPTGAHPQGAKGGSLSAGTPMRKR